MQVRFIQRYGAYWPGANPVLEAVEAARLIAEGVCEPFDKPPAPAPVVVDVEVAPDEPTEVESPAAEDKPDPSAGIRKRGRRS